jgi:hypothetical protein
MSHRKSGLQKDVSTIFNNALIPEEACQAQHEDDQRHTPDSFMDHSFDLAESSTPEQQDALSCDESFIEYELEHEQAIEDRIRLMMESVPCEKDYLCYHSGLEQLCQVRPTADGRLIECLEKRDKDCTFRLWCHGKGFCKCSIRQYIARETGK